MNLKRTSVVDRKRTNIAIIEPSRIIYEGLSNIISKAKRNSYIYWLEDFNEINELFEKTAIDIIIMNPCVIQNRVQEFIRCKKNHFKISWIGLVYSCFDNQLLNRFNDNFSILDSIDIIESKLTPAVKSSGDIAKEQLSDRETDVLVELVNGLSNKEIADKLNISIHTVISHRKNINEKTGIKSLPGLTIFAITQQITSINSIVH
jgi:DNA-binding CsgD family transcriptional regulator